MSDEGYWFPVLRANLPRHLDPNAGPVARCDRCHRSTWDEAAVGNVCGMPQPDGVRCTGALQMVTAL